MSKEFYKLCYNQYEYEMREIDQIYQRVSFTLVLLSLLGGIIFKLGRIDIINLVFKRLDVFIYYFSTLLSIFLVCFGILFAILFILPRRRQYKTIASMALWQKWRKDYENYLKEVNENKGESVDEAMLDEITEKLVDAQATNAPINEMRRQYFYKSVLMVSLCLIPVVVQAIFYLWLKVKGT